MKINPNSDVLKATQTQPQQKPVGTGADQFGSILKQTLDQAAAGQSAGQPAAPVDALHHLGHMTGIQFDPIPAAQPAKVLTRTETLLNTLEAYQQKLNDPSVSLKEIAGLVQEMESQNKTLTADLASLPAGDGLEELLNEALSASSIQVMRFNRGDFSG